MAPPIDPAPAAHPPGEADKGFLDGRGEMAALIRAHDWHNTPLGPIERWPQSLRTTVSLCLASNFPINIVWGPSYTQIYNDGYRIVCGEKHPAALGMDYSVCWESAWPAIGQAFEAALQGETSFLENQRMFLFRNGYLEETFFTFSHSPIRDESGGIGGLFHPVTETTETMIGERRTRAVRDLTACLADAASTADVFRLSAATLLAFDFDLPFLLLYQRTGERRYRLAACEGIAQGGAASPAALQPDTIDDWCFGQVAGGAAPFFVGGLRQVLGAQPCGPYDEAPDQAYCAALAVNGGVPDALLVAGASARLPLSDTYSGFFDLVAAAIGASLARVTAAEEERKRRDMLAAMDRAKTVFFSNVSHEFRTPLTLMLGPLEDALASSALPDEEKDRLGIAYRNAQRLHKLVNSLLDFSRIESGRSDARFVPTDLAVLTRDLASNFRSACAKAGLDLIVDCGALRAPVWVDRQIWETIILNLVSNAFKFTLAGSIRVSLRDEDGGVALTVADTGVGIPAADVGRVFERFHRVEGQRGRSMEGTGIGLALVRELVTLHGGSIDVTSTEGQGSTFRLILRYGAAHLPADQLVEETDAPAPGANAQRYVGEALRWLPDAAAGAPAPPLPNGPTVLLAEDNADMRAYIGRILEEGGCRVRAVADGAAALADIRQGLLPDVVLTDVMMPVMDGFTLLARLRADPATASLLVILLSARAGEEARVEGLQAGADDYMVKPFSARELRARVDGALALVRQRRAAALREQQLHGEIAIQRARADLRESQAHLATLFDQTAAGIAEIDLSGVLQRVNARYCQILGRSADELLGRSLYDCLAPAERAAHLDLLAQAAASGKAFEAEQRYLRPDGAEAWVTTAITPIYLGDNAPARSALAVALDISDRKQAELTLWETVERLEFTLEATQIGTWDLDLVNDRAYRSPRHDQCFGYTAPVAQWGFDIFMAHVHPDDRACVRQKFRDAIAELRDWHFECRVLWPDASLHWLAGHGIVYHHHGKPTRMTGIVMDITERRQAQEKLVQESARKDEFLAMLAHELRNPLAPISAAAELVGMSSLDPKRLKATSAIISRQVRHMTSLVDDLLDVSRVSRGLVDIAKDRVAIADVIASAVEQARPLIDERAQTLSVSQAARDAQVCGDHKRLVQIVANLLNNASKYTPRQGAIEVRTTLDAARVSVAVRDNGIGILPEVQERVFELFAQAERSSDRSQGGLGLGLALVRNLVQLHGGDVACTSPGLGEGSTFTVTLPLLVEHAPTASGAEGSEAPSAEKKLKILVVDDNIDAADMLAMLLQSLGHEVMVEYGSHKALARAPVERPDVCLLDIGLPDMNGNELARRLKTERATSHINLFAVTGYGQQYDRNTALQAGFDQYFVKPVDIEQLNDLLCRIAPA
ncbi:response regulator [Massilia atriviolacea]|uniref:ATP-binding protein n=1 Tax=Massilia atriviolacea TaxID=2495579 RepID=UPI0013DF9CB3|nr:ATP-binding protein [Massilia atriviolacea]